MVDKYRYGPPFVRAMIAMVVLLSGIGGVESVRAASDLSVTLRLDRQKASMADSVRLVVVVSGTREGDNEPRISGTEAFRVSKGRTSSRLQIVNGRVDASVEHTYFLEPKTTGEFTVGPAEITVEGKTLRSNTVTLTITDDIEQRQGDKGAVFLTAEIAPQTVYIEQQAVYTLRLYRRIRVSDLSLSLPETKDLVFKKLGEPSEYEAVYNRKRYQVVEVRYRITPSQEGVYDLEPARMSMTVYEPRSRRGFFDDPFFSNFASGRPATVTANGVVLQVLKLPEKNRPVGFSGLVGDFTISAGLTPSEVTQGQSATFTVVVTGQGNVNRIPDLSMPEIPGLKVYADQPVLETDVRDKALTGSKTMKWALVPEREGRYEIPAMSVSFFDPDRKKYDTLETLPLIVSVLPGGDESEEIVVGVQKDGNGNGSVKKEIETLGRDILPIHGSVEVLHDRGLGDGFPLHLWVVLIGPAFICGAVLIVSKLRFRSESGAGVSKSKRAAKVFEKTCGRGDDTAKGCYEAFRTYLNDRFHLLLGSVTAEETRDILVSNQVRADTVQAAEALVQKLEDAMYAGGGVEDLAAAQHDDRARTVFDTLL